MELWTNLIVLGLICIGIDNQHFALNIYTMINLEEETSHSATHYALAIAEYVEFSDKLVKVVASFSNGCQIRLQQDIIVLLST